MKGTEKKMRVLESIPTVHTEGVIYVDLNVAKQPVFTIGLHVHDSISAAGGNPKLEPHPVQSRLLRGRSALEEIPVRVLFDEARSNILGRYEAWGESPGQGPQCIGNGECAKRYDQESNAWVQTPCRGPSLCPIPANQGVNCSLRTKVILQIVDEGEELGAFEFRSSGESTYRAMLGSLQALQAKHGQLRTLPLTLAGWEKSTQGSSYEPFACATLAIEPVVGKTEHPNAVNEAWELHGKHTQDMWMAECIPTEWEKMPVLLPKPKSRIPAQKSSSNAGAESLFAHVIEQLKDKNEQPHA
jgi:hypothetical protein